ncbi:hypothetical protein MES5069_220182 [Mesorhizobium escarrei]|uniref:Uncharacterized protein n=1 Tax=Mesorhizobium escarrei TaxID=666018 RepID=A0ABM9DS29_9HYPH|nr:hypothetical protein MES5069_220182 [Mesorhizobium escarrei]
MRTKYRQSACLSETTVSTTNARVCTFKPNGLSKGKIIVRPAVLQRSQVGPPATNSAAGTPR